MDKLGVEVRMEEADAEAPVFETCDKIIVAAGAKPVVPPIPGIDGKIVLDVVNVHKNLDKITGKNIVICGGGLSGADLALELQTEFDKQCTIIEMRLPRK